MQALVLEGGGLIYVNDFPVPKIELNQALIRILYAGICSTDLELVKGYASFRGIPGHEFVGIVEKCADNKWLGRRVVGSINLGCGICGICRGSGPEHCPSRTVLGIIDHNGAFADYISLPISNLYPVPESIPDRHAVFVEPLAAALRISEQITLSPSARIGVVGPGKLGMLICQVLALGGGDVTLMGRSRESLDLGIKVGLRTMLVDEMMEDYFDIVVEATGNEMGLAHSLKMVRPLGTLVLKSTFSGKSSIDLTKIVVGEIRVVGSRCGPFEPALRLLADRAVEVEALIDGEFSLKEGPIAFQIASKSGVRKILLHP